MKVLVLFLLAAIGLAFLASTRVGNDDLHAIRELADAGQYQKALDKHLWFHEESKKALGMGAVRLSYAISAWVKLGKKYPPALDALKEVRDTNTAVLLAGTGTFGNFHELAAINRGLGEGWATVDLFIALDTTYPAQARSYYSVAEDLLMQYGKYEIIAKYLDDPVAKFEHLRDSRETHLALAKVKAKLKSPKHLELIDKRYLERVINLVSTLLAINRDEEAELIRTMALAYYPNEEVQLIGL